MRPGRAIFRGAEGGVKRLVQWDRRHTGRRGADGICLLRRSDDRQCVCRFQDGRKRTSQPAPYFQRWVPPGRMDRRPVEGDGIIGCIRAYCPLFVKKPGCISAHRSRRRIPQARRLSGSVNPSAVDQERIPFRKEIAQDLK